LIGINLTLFFFLSVGRETARLVGLGTNIHSGEEIRNTTLQSTKDLIWEADGFAAVLPSDKREVVLTLRNVFGIVTGMTGDGVSKCNTFFNFSTYSILDQHSFPTLILHR
jgi:hypothetical protein